MAKSKYKRIQFLGYGIRTDVANVVSHEVKRPPNAPYKFMADGQYLGLPDENRDIEARCALMSTAIHLAAATAEASSDTLKVFMSPEFFFRGAKGAYSFEARDKLTGMLQDLVKSAKWQDWLFVFGSIISWSAPALRQSRGLFARDTYECIDPAKAKEVYNTVLVQQGGWEGQAASDCAWLVIKEFKSDIDFKWFDAFLSGRSWADAPTDMTMDEYETRDKLGNVSHMKSWKPALSDWEVWEDFIGNKPQAQLDKQFDEFKKKQEAKFSVFAESRAKPLIDARKAAWQKAPSYHRYAGTGVFRFHDIDFGLDVCLDHSKRRLAKSANGRFVDVQLIPSAGMSIRNDGVVAKEGGFVFNCDGTRSHRKMPTGLSPAAYRDEERTSSPCVALTWSKPHPRAIKPRCKPIEVPRPANIDKLFVHGAGNVHLLEPVDL